ncbi:hypothetical protein GCWU000324_01914 [Kingella oralis ATCC 51147]|uniref:Uncharacterized protein n=1 Tax=Kingella oralis ATCC 51147 TaxID=629741 RepID=C4GIP3_9NEIS|nr:hypothetical protein GCWU000324_01914 [Kingella oralis ATCC 51147]
MNKVARRFSGCLGCRTQPQRQPEKPSPHSKPQTGAPTRKSKEFIRGLMAYIKAHYQHPRCRVFERRAEIQTGKIRVRLFGF